MKLMSTHWNAGNNAIVVGNGDAIESIDAALQASGAQIIRFEHAQLANETAIAEQFNVAAKQFNGPVTTLVFADMLASEKSAEQLNIEQWRATAQINLDARFFCCTELARSCIAQRRKGVILHVVSKAAQQAKAGLSPTASAAAGVETLNMSLAAEWGRDNIRSNIIATRLLDSSSVDDEEALNSLGAVAAYYCSDYASYITGSCIGVNEI